MKSAIRIFAFALASTSIVALAQPAAPANALASTNIPVKVEPKQPYDSTKAQLAVEKEKNFQLQFAQIQEQVKQKDAELQKSYQEQEQFLTSWEASVRGANKWDDTYTYSRDTDTWTHAPKAEAKKPEAVPPTKK